MYNVIKIYYFDIRRGWKMPNYCQIQSNDQNSCTRTCIIIIISFSIKFPWKMKPRILLLLHNNNNNSSHYNYLLVILFTAVVTEESSVTIFTVLNCWFIGCYITTLMITIIWFFITREMPSELFTWNCRIILGKNNCQLQQHIIIHTAQ